MAGKKCDLGIKAVKTCGFSLPFWTIDDEGPWLSNLVLQLVTHSSQLQTIGEHTGRDPDLVTDKSCRHPDSSKYQHADILVTPNR